MTQSLQKFFIVFEQVERQADKVVEVHCAAIGEGALIIRINRQPHLCQRKRRRRLVQQAADSVGSQPSVLGRTDECQRQAFHHVW